MTRVRHSSRSRSRRSVPSISIAPALRVVKAAEELRERGLARAVLPDDRERGSRRNREVEAIEDRPLVRLVRKREIPDADLVRGHPAAGRAPRRSAPISAIDASSRNAAPTGCDAPSSAQLRPPNAIELVPTAAVANTTRRARLRLPEAAASASAQNTTPLAARTNASDHTTDRSRNRVARHCSSNNRRRRIANFSTVQSERPNRRSSFAAGGSTARRYA